ncbi:MAG: hypothetical protein H6738_12425 [Alphaproteobacteria bacterium]|nr:hypothetical protein [Alphaproteobacteria bacterium]
MTQALLQIFLLPILSFLVLLVVVGSAEGSGDVALGMAVVLGPLTLLGMAWGAFGLARSGSVSTATRVEVDLGGGVLRHARGEVPLSRVRSLVLRQGNALQKWLWLGANVGVASEAAEGGPYAPPSGESFGLLTRLPPTLGSEVGELGRALAADLGVELGVEGGVDRGNVLGMTPGTLAMLCYLPFQGIFLVVSVPTSFLSKDPLVRFHARQSLVLFAVEVVALIVAVGLMVGVSLVHTEAGIVVGGLALLGVLAARLVVRIVACFKAARMQPFVLPGLSPVVARWLP